jgi:sugar transferase EpsL
MVGKSSACIVKRAMDILLTVFGLAVAGPVMLILAGLVRIHFGAPVFFRQQRPGLHCRPFTILKFRTMTDARDLKGKLLPDEQRLTGLGSFLRSTSLDELPELINVLKGEMSLVGPRPLVMRYVEYFRPNEIKRQEVRPGITGWAQIHGRNHLPWDERLALDAWYVENWSPWLDIRILALTIGRVMTRQGAVPDTDKVETDLSLERTGSCNSTNRP